MKEAADKILLYPLDPISQGTGPKTRVPMMFLFESKITTAFSSKDNIEPSSLHIFCLVQIITLLLNINLTSYYDVT